ncbi:MAG TPA: tetratricopeptide repeat protein [Gemmatimonadaceae bacterium]|nr:tetratricopeptide repeat protein [Gemmatimonadaceae bacterium]
MTIVSLSHRLAFAAGTRLLHKQRWMPAAFLLRRAARLAPNHWESHNNLAVALLKLERWEEAARTAERAVALDPASVDSRDFLGIALLQLQRWEEAVTTYRAAIQADASRYDSFDRLGMALMQLERWDDVVDTYEAALALDSGRYAAHQRLGIALQRLRRWDAAATAFRRALALAARDPATAGEVVGLELSVASVEARQDTTVPSRQLPSPEIIAQVAERQASFWTVANLGTGVFAVERWLEDLSAPAGHAQSGSGPRLLFVLDNDFGELTTFKYLLLGQPQLAARTTLLLPERLFAHNADAVAGRTHRYATAKDVLDLVDREQPGIVFLCSAYLFCPHLEWSVANLERLIAALRARGCRIVTADPYLGMLSRQDAASLVHFEISREHAKKLAAVSHMPEAVEKMRSLQNTLAAQAWEVLRQSERILRDTYHLYPTYCDVTNDVAAETDARNMSFFNDRLAHAPSHTREGAPHWLFILASADYDIQSVAEGDAFADVVARKLVETRAAGRHPILIAPAEFLEELLLRLSSLDGIDLLSHCPFNRYLSLLLSAEHVFYWNAVSHSLLIRLFNQRPVVLFDRGHLLRTAPAIRERIVAWYYQGFEAPIRDHQQVLTVERVEDWAADYRRHAARLVERFRRAPAPEDMIAQLVARAPSPAPQTTLSYR